MNEMRIDRSPAKHHTHYLLSDGSIVPIKRYPGLLQGDLISFTFPSQPVMGVYGPSKYLEVPAYMANPRNYTLEVIGFLYEREKNKH